MIGLAQSNRQEQSLLIFNSLLKIHEKLSTVEDKIFKSVTVAAGLKLATLEDEGKYFPTGRKITHKNVKSGPRGQIQMRDAIRDVSCFFNFVDL
ncbi:hypothetical protein RQP46_010803 [Phenoliferia psychrophenolica]